LLPKLFTTILYVVLLLLLALGHGFQRIQEKGDVAACLLFSKATWYIQDANLGTTTSLREKKHHLKD
jgi:hypothetical protein